MSGHHDRTSGSLAASSIVPMHGAQVPSAAQPVTAPTEAPAGDPLSDVLRTVKLNAALFFVVDASSPWSIAVPHASAFAPIILPRAQHTCRTTWSLAGKDGSPCGASRRRGSRPATCL